MKKLNRSLAARGWMKAVQFKSRETFLGLKRVIYILTGIKNSNQIVLLKHNIFSSIIYPQNIIFILNKYIHKEEYKAI